MGGACAESAKGHTEKCTFEFWNVILAMNLQRSIQWEGGSPPPPKKKILCFSSPNAQTLLL